MAIIPITEDNLQVYKTVARPKRLFSSSSLSGVSGSFLLNTDFSKSIKDSESNITRGTYEEKSLEQARQKIIEIITDEPQNFPDLNSTFTVNGNEYSDPSSEHLQMYIGYRNNEKERKELQDLTEDSFLNTSLEVWPYYRTKRIGTKIYRFIDFNGARNQQTKLFHENSTNQLFGPETSGQISISAWVTCLRNNNIAGFSRLIDIGGIFQVAVTSAGKIAFYTKYESTNYVGWKTTNKIGAILGLGSKAFSSGTPFHVAVTYNPTDFNLALDPEPPWEENDRFPKIYINGVNQQLSVSGEAQPSKNSRKRSELVERYTVVGNRFEGDRPWVGQVAELAVWNKELSDIEIEAIYEGTKKTKTAQEGITEYLDLVNTSTHSIRQTKRQEVRRYIPGTRMEDNFFHKFTIRNTLFKHYRIHYPTAHWSYTNYNSLNFFTSEATESDGSLTIPNDSVLVYPAATSSLADGGGDVNKFAPSGSFTFDFYIKPKGFTNKDAKSQWPNDFMPGCILHMSSCYAISLTPGSDLGPDGRPESYGLMLQLSSSADISPYSISFDGDHNPSTTHPESAQGDPANALSHQLAYIFTSSAGSLKRDKWHHVSIRWGGTDSFNGYGNITIDGKIDSPFVLSESVIANAEIAKRPIDDDQAPGFGEIRTNLIMQDLLGDNNEGVSDPDGLFVGNYYEGTNIGDEQVTLMFAPSIANEEGLTVLSPALDGVGDIDLDDSDAVANRDVIEHNAISAFDEGVKFEHPLNAEIHDLKIYDHYRLDLQVKEQQKKGSEIEPGLLFYVPPFFVKETRERQILQTPFQKTSGSTDAPYNTHMSFGVAGLDINLENFVRDFVTGEYPRLFKLKSGQVKTQVDDEGLTANMIMYSQSSHRKRNYTILPCDNGKFFPNFNLLASGSSTDSPDEDHPEGRFINDLGKRDLTVISLNNMLKGEERLLSFNEDGVGTMSAAILASTPERPREAPQVGYRLDSKNIMTVFQRTGDDSSNEVVFFDVSNLFYGDRIYPGTVVLADNAMTGSGGEVRITLKDDGSGNLYRDNTDSEVATWSSVGNVLYDDGIIAVKSPHLSLFGLDGYTISFEGERHIHTMEYQIPAPAGLINSSSNPAYKDLVPSDYGNENANKFVYLSGVQLHDNNLNVVMRSNFAQPVIKRDGDRILVKIRVDF